MALALLALASCSPSPKAGGGIGGTGSVSSVVSSGTVTKLGSVSVSGTQYDNSNAFYCIDGEPCSTENSLKLGMVVLVKGTALSPPEGSVTRVADTIISKRPWKELCNPWTQTGPVWSSLDNSSWLNQKTVIDESIPGRSLRNLRPGVDRHTSERPGRGRRPHFGYLGYETHRQLHYEVQGIIKNHDAEVNVSKSGN